MKSTHFSAIPMTIFLHKRVAKSKVAKSYNGDSDLEKEWKRKASIPKCFLKSQNKGAKFSIAKQPILTQKSQSFTGC